MVVLPGSQSLGDGGFYSAYQNITLICKPAREFEAVPSVHGIDYFKHRPIDRRPVDGE
jgi:hypothetical protein